MMMGLNLVSHSGPSGVLRHKALTRGHACCRSFEARMIGKGLAMSRGNRKTPNRQPGELMLTPGAAAFTQVRYYIPHAATDRTAIAVSGVLPGPSRARILSLELGSTSLA